MILQFVWGPVTLIRVLTPLECCCALTVVFIKFAAVVRFREQADLTQMRGCIHGQLHHVPYRFMETCQIASSIITCKAHNPGAPRKVV